MKLIVITLTVFFGVSMNCYSQTVGSFKIKKPAATSETIIPASVNLDEYTFLQDSAISLWQMRGNEKIQIPSQVRQGITRTLHWLITPDHLSVKEKFLSYFIETKKNIPVANIVSASGKGALTFIADNHNLLSYQFQTVYPPTGQDSNYKRSGFIHPLWTPHGQVLTAIQPKDHYHHYGIWNPWTHTVFEKDTVDFWNIKGHQGTVRFAKFLSQTNGPVFSEFETLHEHVVFKKNGSEKIALNELQTIRVYNPQGEKNYYIVDFTSQLSCASESPLLIVAYRYAGFGWRATEEWDKTNCEVMTSEGKVRKNTDGTKARWIAVQGKLSDDYGGMVMMSYPANYNHPEPLRIWDENGNSGRGDMFANFATTKDKDWLLEPGKTYTLKYRLLVYNGKMKMEKAETAWQNFSTPPVRVN